MYSKKVAKSILYLAHNFNYEQAKVVMGILNELDKLDLKVAISEAQNIYFAKVLKEFKKLAEITNKDTSEESKSFMHLVLQIGKRLNIDTTFYQHIFDRALLTD